MLSLIKKHRFWKSTFPHSLIQARFGSAVSSTMSLSRFRELMRAEPAIDAVIIPSGDAHQSEYVACCDERRSFISGFSGSAGTALVLQHSALLWTDGRYFLQAARQLSADWTLMKSGEPSVPTMEEWLLEHMSSGQRVGVDAELISGRSAHSLSCQLAAKGIDLVPLQTNFVDEIWTNRPAPSKSPIKIHPFELAGEDISTKLDRVREILRNAEADAAVFSCLDEIMWLYNIRGNDIDYNPVVKSYAVVTTGGDAHLFVDTEKLPSTNSDVTRASSIQGVVTHPYSDIGAFLLDLVNSNIRIAVDSSQLSWKLCSIVKKPESDGRPLIDIPSCIAMLKSIKNEVELQGIREAHCRDGAALTAFLAWLDSAVKGGAQLSEFEAAEKLEEFRQRMPYWVSPSFATISGYGSNAAIIHYRAEADTCAQLGTASVYLLDSGAQYLDGTTDVTRTMHFGTSSDRIKMCYTYVLKGHIALGSAVFPEGTTGSRLDSFARRYLWGAGLDYNHGTGHGVGAFLNVHEGPQGIGFRPRANEVGFYAGMTTSNEPGYYEDGSFGIRIENICIVVPATTPNNFADRKFLKFETVTMCPIETELIDFSLLSNEEIQWLNDYHGLVREKLLPQMKSLFPDAVDYLLRKTECVDGVKK